MRRFFLMCVALLVSGGAAFGYTNVLENGTNQTITTGWDAGGDMTVGGTTSNNTLAIIAGGSLTNINAFVGKEIGASNNTATVSGTGAEWISTGTLQIGVAGNTNNSVSVSNGGAVTASNLVLDAASGFNLGNNGKLSLSEGLNVSQAGFNWSSGGTLSVGGEFSGLTNLAGARVLTLDGGNAAWDLASTNILIGDAATLTTTNGATLNAANLYAEGSGTTVNAGTNSWLLVGDGADKAALAAGGVMVASTNGAVLGVDDSATVNISEILAIGASATATGTVSVANGGTIAAGGLDIFDANSAFNLEDGGTLVMTGDFDATSGAGFNWKDGGTLTVNQNLTLNETFGGTNRTLNVDGGSWNRGGDLAIDGSGNTNSILNGGGVTNDDAYVGGSNNTVVVSGDGSVWLNNGSLNITQSGNRVAVGSGGRVTANSLNIAAGNSFDLNNLGTLAMTGGFNLSEQTNLNWNAGGNLSVGGRLEGMAVATNLPMADAAYLAGGKILTLDGAGRWLNGSSNLVVGLDNDLNRLVLTNGGTVDNADGYIGWGASGDLNSVVVGAGSAWTNHGGGLYVGRWFDASTNLVDAGVSNSLSVADGGWVFVGEGRTNGTTGGLVVASTNGAELVVGGKGSKVEVEQGLYVGVDAITTGSVSVASGGMVSVGELVIATNSTFDLFGTLAVAGGFDADQNGFVWNDGGSLSVGGVLDLDTFGGTNRTIGIAGGSWTNFLGVEGVGNTVSITESGKVFSASAFIGDSADDVGNTVLVGGTGSVWTLTGNLSVNPSNTLALAAGGLVSVDGNMTVNNATVDGSGAVKLTGGTSSLSIYGAQSHISTNVLFEGNGGEVAFTDSEWMVDGLLSDHFTGFGRLAMTNSLLGGTGTVDGFANVDLTGGWIAPNGELVIDGAFKADDTTLQVIAGADHLSITNSGAVNLLGLKAGVTITNTTVTSAFSEEILSSADGFTAGGFASTNFNEHFLLYDFALTDDGTTVAVVAEAAADGEIGASVAYAGIQGIRAGFNGMQNAAFVRTKQLRRNTVATDHAVSHEAYLMSIDYAPSGPRGPGDKNVIFGMHFWADHFSGQGDYDAMGNSDGFSLNNNGTSFGLDKLLGDSLVLGINYTYVRSAARATGGDRVDTETYWLGLYSEWFSENDYYLEGLLALGWSDYDTVRTDVGYTGEGSFEGSDLGGHIEAGKYFHSKHWAVAPYAGLHYLGIESDAYTETSGNNELMVDGQNVASLESALGIKLRNRFDTQAGRFQTVGYAEWAYDFINDDIGSTLSDGTISVGTARIAPGASLINVGAGLSWICTDYLEIGVGYDGRFNENYEEHMGSIMLDVRF